MKRWVLLFILIAISFSVTPADAVTTINFDDVDNMTMIDNYYSALGVVFSTSGEAGYSDGHAYARYSSLNVSSPNVIGGYKSGYPFFNDTHNTGIAEFTYPTNKVEIWATPYSDEYLSAWMKIYDYDSGDLRTTITAIGEIEGEAELLSITSPGWKIGKVEFSGADKRVGFDNFSFNVVPEPVSSILFVTGGAILAVRRYWRKKFRVRS